MKNLFMFSSSKTFWFNFPPGQGEPLRPGQAALPAAPSGGRRPGLNRPACRLFSSPPFRIPVAAVLPRPGGPGKTASGGHGSTPCSPCQELCRRCGPLVSGWRDSTGKAIFMPPIGPGRPRERTGTEIALLSRWSRGPIMANRTRGGRNGCVETATGYDPCGLGDTLSPEFGRRPAKPGRAQI